MSGVTKRRILVALALLLALSAAASAQPRPGWGYARPRAYIYAPFAYAPFAGPFWGYYPYVGYPYGVGHAYADVRTQVMPKQAQIYVDGFYAGVADEFDGAFKRLHLTPGGHAITLYLEGYRTVTQNVYVRPDSTFKLNDTLEQLSSGETSAAPPSPTRSPGRLSSRLGQG